MRATLIQSLLGSDNQLRKSAESEIEQARSNQPA
jgi:hypothetical protein